MFYGNFKPEANRNNFLIVAPDGQDNGTGRHYSFGTEPGLQNDLTMVQALLRTWARGCASTAPACTPPACPTGAR